MLCQKLFEFYHSPGSSRILWHIRIWTDIHTDFGSDFKMDPTGDYLTPYALAGHLITLDGVQQVQVKYTSLESIIICK